MSLDPLRRWLDQGLAFGAEYQGALSNHLPMNLIALHRLGATDAQCERFIESYTPRLEPLAADDTAITDWRDHRGAHAHNAAYRRFFAAQLATRGRAAVLAGYLPQLAPGVSGAAFHPLIRLAFALEADSDPEVAEALASWCMAYQELGPLTAGDQPPPRALAAAAEAYRAAPTALGGDTLFDRLKAAAATPAFATWNGRIAAAPSALAETALALYAGSGNGFLALHLVTATHAARRVLAHTACAPLLPALAQSLLAAHLVMGGPPIRPPAPAARTPGWDEILDAARASTNDHDAKFCYALSDEQSVYGDAAYQREAARRMKLSTK